MHRTTTIGILALAHNFCQSISPERGAGQAMKILSRGGGTFLRQYVKGHSTVNPVEYVDEPGSIINGINFQHSLLIPDTMTLFALRNEELAIGDSAIGGFGYLADTQTVIVTQSPNIPPYFPVRHSDDAIATGLLALALHLYPYLLPTYGWVDEYGWNLPEGQALISPSPKYLFWATFFGPEYVKTIGRDFLKRAPGWTSVDLENGGILHVATESYRDWWENDQRELLRYFRQKFPKVHLHRAQPFP